MYETFYYALSNSSNANDAIRAVSNFFFYEKILYAQKAQKTQVN